MATDPPVLAAWEEVLSRFAECLGTHRTALDGGHSEVFVPPVGLPPLPEELLPRAELLMLEARALERAQALRLIELRRLRQVTVPNQRLRSSLLDTRG